MSSPSSIDLVEVTSILKELSALSKEKNNNNGSSCVPDRLCQLNGNTDNNQLLSDSDSGIIASHADDKMSDGSDRKLGQLTGEAPQGAGSINEQLASPKESRDVSSPETARDTMTSPAGVDNSQSQMEESELAGDALASKVEKALAGMKAMSVDLGDDLDISSSEELGDVGADDSQDDIIDLTLTGLRREVIDEENEEMESVSAADSQRDEVASQTSVVSVQERVMGDSETECKLLEQTLLLERSQLQGDDAGEDGCEGEGQSEASYSGSDDSLHAKVERSLAGSTASLNDTVIGSENGSENSDEYSSTIQGMNSRDELEIYDSRDLQNGVHQLSNGSLTYDNKERAKTAANGSCVPAIFTINQLKRKFDSVDNIMDRIDAGISTLRDIEMPTRESPTEELDQSESRSINAADNPVTSADESKPPQLADNMKDVAGQTYSKSAPNLDLSWQLSQPYNRPSFLHEEKEESDGAILTDDDVEPHLDDVDDNMADEDSFGLSGADNLSDLDSDAANSTNAKFSEILRNKQINFGDPRVSALRQQEAATETESIRTEDFESAFQKSLPAASRDNNLKSLQAHSIAESTDTPLTEDFEDRFKANLKFSQIPVPDAQRRTTHLPLPTSSSVGRNSAIRRRSPVTTRRTPPPPKRTSASKNTGYSAKPKVLDTQRGVDTLDELSDLEPETRTRMRPTSPHHAAPIVSNGFYEADSESEDGEFAQQIREQSSRIQKEIELERRLKTRQAQRVGSAQPPQTTEFTANEQQGYSSLERHNSLPRYRGSTSYSNLPAAQDMHAFHSYSASTPDVSALLTAQQTSNLMKSQMEEDSNTMKRLNDDRMQMMQEISRLQEELKGLEEEVRTTELQAKENRSRSEESRSHLMVAEFKKEAILKEIGRLNGEVEQGKRIIEEAHKLKEQEDNVLTTLNLTIQQVPAIVEERNELRAKVESLDKAGESLKDDLCKQVQDVKTEAANCQENMQEKIDTLRDTVQRLNAQLERVTNEKDEFKKERDVAIAKCDSLQRDMAAGEQAKAQALEQTIKGYDDMRRRLEKESAEAHTQLTNELNGTRKLLDIEEQKCTKLREEIVLRDELNESLREQLNSVRQKASEEEDSHDKLLREMKQQLRDCDNERLAAWDACKQQFEVEKDKLLEMTRDDLERQHSELLAAVREEHSRHLTQLQNSLKNKESEAYMLRDRLSQQEQESKRTVETLKADARRQVEEAVHSEKKIWEKEQKYLENEQLKHFREKEENQLEQVKLQMETESRRRQQLEEHLQSVKSELEESAQYNQRVNQEKQALAQKLKQAEDNQSNEVNKSKKELKQHYEKMMSALREEMEEKEQELERLRQENSTIVQSEAESSQALEKFEKMMIHEINEECKKTADLLGVQPRKAQTVSFSRSSSPSKARVRKRSSSRSLSASAVANLRACNEELRNSLAELKSEVAELSSTVERSEKAKELELEQLRNRLSNEKRQEVEEMRMSLAKQQQAFVAALRQPVQSASTRFSSKSELTDSVAQSTDLGDIDGECNCMPACRRSLTEPRDSYQVKVERKASDKALRRSLTGSYTSLNGAAPELQSRPVADELRESSGSQPMQGVQDRLRHIRAGSPFRYRSNPSLANQSADANKYTSSQTLSTAGMDSLEQKVRLAELKARLADERANRNQAMLSQKMHEVNELQHTLNSQTKEIMGLERSYDDLRSAQYAPSRYSMLNNTFPR